MTRDDLDRSSQDLENLDLDTEIGADEELDDEDLDNVAGGWSGEDGGG